MNRNSLKWIRAVQLTAAAVATLVVCWGIPPCSGQESSPRLVGVSIDTTRDAGGWRATREPASKWREVSAEALPDIISKAALATVRVQFAGGEGTGVHLGDGLYLTAAHVGRGEPPSAIVTFKGGIYDRAKVIGKDEQFDLMLLEGEVRAQMPSAPLHDQNIGIGETVYLVGCSRGRLVAWEGPVESYSSPGGASPPDWMEIRGAAIPGDSGGPVFTETGLFCGVLWGEDGRSTVASNCGRVRRFLLPWNARLAGWQQAQCQGSYCQPQYQQPQYQQPQYQQPQRPQTGIGQRIPITGSIGDPTPVPGSNAGGPSTAQPAVPTISDEAIAKHIFAQMQANPENFRGEKGDRGPKGEPGDAGQVSMEQLESVVVAVSEQLRSDPAMRGPAGEDAKIGDAEIQKIALAVLKAIPPTKIRSIDPETGEATELGVFHPGMDNLDLVGAGDLEITDAMVAKIAKRLPPVILQPTWKGQNGETRRTDEKLVGQLGEPIDVPPVTLNVHGRNGKTIANGPLGGHVAFKLGETE